MHIPDGVIDGATSAGFGVAAAGGLGAALRESGRRLNDRQIPFAGLVAAFVFAAQMFNFPLIAGMSGHLLGGVLAAVLVGPWAGFVVMSIVLVVQALLFADGGLTALGLSIVNMAAIGGLGGYTIYVVIHRLMGRRPAAVMPAAATAAGISVPLAALGFVVQFAVGGTADVPLGAVAGAMVGTHVLIGVGEGALTALIVGAVMASRPDLVHGNPNGAPLPRAEAV